MSTENKELIKSMVKTSDMSISFTHRNEITTLKTVIDRLSSNRLISNFLKQIIHMNFLSLKINKILIIK